MPTGLRHAPPTRSLTARQQGSFAADTTALVVGHDRHPASQTALRCALQLCEQLRAHLHVLHSITLQDYGIDPDIEAFEHECQRNLTAERQTIADTLANTAIRWSYHEHRGHPAHQLAQLADTVNASLIIVGATQPGLLRHLINPGNSVPNRLLHLQERPVLVVPATATRH